MKKLLVTLLVAATSINFVACGSSDKAYKKGEENNSTATSTDAKVTLTVQAE